MHHTTKKHIVYYAGLSIVLLSGLFLIRQSLHDLNLVMAITLFLSLFYVVWGILHHFIHHDIHAKVVIEYVLIGIMGISAVYFTLFLLK